MSRMESEFGASALADIDDLEDKADQIHRVLLTLTSGETEDLMVGASNGFEAYRRVHRRWDPRTSGRKRNILRAILQPERVKTWTAVRPAIEQLEELIRRYEARRNAAGVTVERPYRTISSPLHWRCWYPGLRETPVVEQESFDILCIDQTGD